VEFCQPGCDFDVRGFHLQSREKYFDFRRHRDIIEVMDGDFDLVSFDIDKMFGLLASSNPTVFEWIRAHICYVNILPDWKTLQNEIVDNYDFQALYYHYLSLAKVQLHDMEKGNKFTYKKGFLLYPWIIIIRSRHAKSYSTVGRGATAEYDGRSKSTSGNCKKQPGTKTFWRRNIKGR
jgi:predicted nucleotidyltransferase